MREPVNLFEEHYKINRKKIQGKGNKNEETVDNQ